MKGQVLVGIFGMMAVLQAIGQPVIVVQPQNQTIIENAPCTFSVQATGIAPLRYQWLEYTNFVTSGFIPGATDAVLHFGSVPYTYHGFAVVVSDAQGSVTSRVARINFALRFFQQPISQTVTAGFSATFQAQGLGPLPFTYQWRFGEFPLPGETGPALVLPEAQPEDAGPFSVVLNCAQGSITSQVATLTIVPSTNATARPIRPFVNFETPPIHPIALSPDHSRLVVCNLPDGRLEVFDVRERLPRLVGNVPVGIDPVTARFRTTNEVWVVNHISDSVNVVDLDSMRVRATLQTLDAPADVVFAGNPPRAFVSCAMEDTVLVFDPLTHQRIAAVPIDGDRPKAMCVSPDGRQVYVAIFESGNASTILAPLFALKGPLPLPGVLQATNGPYRGTNPPPNSGTNFSPAINTNIPGNLRPAGQGHIVKKDAAGRWMDDNNGDWTEFVSGARAEVSGRVAGWDMPDHDVAIIDTETLEVRYASGLMNLCMAIAVNPATQEFTVVGTDGLNEVRFEPNLKGIFLRVNLARYDPATQEKQITDLNPHLDYAVRTLPLSERRKSIGDPRAVVWKSHGAIGYVTGMGSGNLIAVDAAGNRVGAPLELGDGACGIALDETRDVLYVLNRFAATVSVVDADDWEVEASVPLFDPTPAPIKLGRKHFYDTHKTSGLGYVSCASCHPDGRMDRLAWDLGDPAGQAVTVNFQFSFHPMKGPMVTLTLQDIIGHEPFHWRGDRTGIEDFNQTFPALLGGPMLTTNEMREFKNFLATLTFPPNRHRNFDNSLSTNKPLPGHFASGRNQLPFGTPLPNGNALRGLNVFNSLVQPACVICHRGATGMGPDIAVLAGPNGERRINSAVLGRNNNLPFKMVQLRNLPDKLGMNVRSNASRAGFGFSFNGRVDTLERFLDHGFQVFGDQTTADVVAFLLSFVGGDHPTNALPAIPPFQDVMSNDTPAGAGKQATITGSEEPQALQQILHLADKRRSRTELVVRDGQRAWVYNRLTRRCQADRQGETVTLDELRALATEDNPLTFLMVPQGSGRRLAVDRDEDGYFDGDELVSGADPANPLSIPVRAKLSLDANSALISWNTVTGQSYRVQFSDDLHSGNWSAGPEVTAASTNTALQHPRGATPQRFYRIQAIKQ